MVVSLLWQVAAVVHVFCMWALYASPPHHTVAQLPARFPADPFFYEFFLTHPVFISLDHLCSILKATYSGRYQHSQENVTQIVVVLDDGSEEEDVDAGNGEDSSTDATKRK